MYEVRLANFNEFRESKELWTDLASKMYRPSVFCTWEWIYTWWENFGKDYDPLILFIHKGKELRGILPLAYSRKRLKKDFVTGRILNFCGSRDVYPDHLDIISSKEDAEPCINAGFDFLSREHGEWDVVHLSHLSEDGELIRVLSKKEKPHDIEQITVSPYISLNGDFEQYMRRFNKKHRHNINRLKNRLYEKYGVQPCVCNNDDVDELESTLEELFNLHLARKESRGTESSFTGDTIRHFHYDFAKKAGKRGWLRLVSLRQENRPVAAGYGFTFGGRFSYFQSGLDPEWEKHSVGSTLLLELIEGACKEGCSEFDFLRGNEEYKRGWTETSRNLMLLRLYKANLKGKLLRSWTHSMAFMMGSIKKVIKKW